VNIKGVQLAKNERFFGYYWNFPYLVSLSHQMRVNKKTRDVPGFQSSGDQVSGITSKNRTYLLFDHLLNHHIIVVPNFDDVYTRREVTDVDFGFRFSYQLINELLAVGV